MNKKIYALLAGWFVLCLLVGVGIAQVVIGTSFTQEEFNKIDFSKTADSEYEPNIKILSSVVEDDIIVYYFVYDTYKQTGKDEWELVEDRAAFSYPREYYDNCINNDYSKYFCDAIVRENIVSQAKDMDVMLRTSFLSQQYERHEINVVDIGITDAILNDA